ELFPAFYVIQKVHERSLTQSRTEFSRRISFSQQLNIILIKEKHNCNKVAYCASINEEVPDDMCITFLESEEYDADRVEDTTCENKPYAGRVCTGSKERETNNDSPAHRQVKRD